jgi:cyanate lyase
MAFRLICALKCALKKSNQASRNVAARALYEVIEKSREHDHNAYRYKALIRVKNTVSSIDKTALAAEIQRSMGCDPFAYRIYDVHGCTRNGIVELTWKSWDSCD